MRLYPYRLFFACKLDVKGPDPVASERLAHFIKSAGLIHFAYRTDKEPAIVALIQDACRRAGRSSACVPEDSDSGRPTEMAKGSVMDTLEEDGDGTDEHPPTIDKSVIAVPEHSAPGESQSNGKAEASVKTLVDLLRTLKLSLESRLGGRIPSAHPILAWLIEHAAYLLNKYWVSSDGSTAYARLHGKDHRDHIAEFGERIMWFVPKKKRLKLDARWRMGVFLGRSMNTDFNYIGLNDGSVVCARAMVRVVPSRRWDVARVLAVRATPMIEKTRSYEGIEEEDNPHEHPEPTAGLEPEGSVLESRRLKITLPDLRAHGFTDGCPKCVLHKKGEHMRAKNHNHTEKCRERVYEALRIVGSEKMRMAEQDNPRRTKTKGAQVADEQVPIVEVPDAPDDQMTELPEPADAEVPELIDDGMSDDGPDAAPMDNTEDFDLEVDEAQSGWGNGEDSVMVDSIINHPMTMLMDNLQCLGVEADTASRFATSVMHKSSKLDMASMIQQIKNEPSLIEVYGRGGIIHAANDLHPSLNIKGLHALDLRTTKPTGGTWDFSLQSDRVEALELIKATKPDWVILSPPCTAFSVMNNNVNYPKMDKDEVQRRIREGTKHLHFNVTIARMQLQAGRHFLFEHPLRASSWDDSWMVNLMKHKKVHVGHCHQCQYGATALDSSGVRHPVLKPTKWMSSSPHVIQRLTAKCSRDHDHLPLQGKNLAEAAFYPQELILAILRGIRDTYDAEASQTDLIDSVTDDSLARMTAASVDPRNAMPISAQTIHQTEDVEADVKSMVIPFKFADGRKVQVKLSDHFKPRYRDEYTGEDLPTSHTHKAILDELQYLNNEVWEGVDIKEALSEPDAKVIGTRWVNCNKRDIHDPDVRARLVAQEVNTHPEDSFFAATPPLEAKRMLMSEFATERYRDGKPLKLSFIDVRKAYFNGIPTRKLFVRLPKELGLPPNIVGKLKKCIYGTRDAGAIWEGCYGDALANMGFAQGKASPCCFYSAAWNVSVVVHGDDFTALGTATALDLYEAGMSKAFEVKLRGRMGPEPNDLKEIQILNRIVRYNDDGLTYEADPRHVELIIKALNLEDCKKVITPGVKTTYEQMEEEEHLKSGDDPAPVVGAVTMATMRSPEKAAKFLRKITFSPNVDTHDVPAYSEEYGIALKSFVISAENDICSFRRVGSGRDPFTGRSMRTMRGRRERLADIMTFSQRTQILRRVLRDGAAWETPTTVLLSAVTKTKKFKKKRIGSKAAKALERLHEPSDILVGEDATEYRAVAARANYLALDRPDIAYATKELCRDFGTPTKFSVERLKRLGRYLNHHRRLVWHFKWQTPDPALDVFIDTDFAGCLKTRRSTSGGLVMRGTHLLKHWSTTQSVVTLSSAEAELTGICKGGSLGLGMQSIARDLGFHWALRLHSDATAAIGICRRRGLGKVRHLAVADLWVQDRLRTKDFLLSKVLGTENPADMLTKHVERALIDRHIARSSLEFEEGRAKSAPSIER